MWTGARSRVEFEPVFIKEFLSLLMFTAFITHLPCE